MLLTGKMEQVLIIDNPWGAHSVMYYDSQKITNMQITCNVDDFSKNSSLLF